MTTPTTGTADRALQEIQTGILFFILFAVTDNGLLSLLTAVAGAAYSIGGIIRVFQPTNQQPKQK
jgi:hypothetical protein